MHRVNSLEMPHLSMIIIMVYREIFEQTTSDFLYAFDLTQLPFGLWSETVIVNYLMLIIITFALQSVHSSHEFMQVAAHSCAFHVGSTGK